MHRKSKISLVLFRDSYNFDLFDACVTPSVGSSFDLSVLFGLLVPSRGVTTSRPFCSLSGDVSGFGEPAMAEAYPTRGITTQRTEAKSPCAVRTRDGSLNSAGAKTETNVPMRLRMTDAPKGWQCAHAPLNSKNTNRTNGRTAIRKEVPASQQRVRHWTFTRFRQCEVTGRKPWQAGHGRATTGRYPPRLKKLVSYPREFEVRGSTKTSSHDWQNANLQCFGDESVLGIPKQFCS